MSKKLEPYYIRNPHVLSQRFQINHTFNNTDARIYSRVCLVGNILIWILSIIFPYIDSDKSYPDTEQLRKWSF